MRKAVEVLRFLYGWAPSPCEGVAKSYTNG